MPTLCVQSSAKESYRCCPSAPWFLLTVSAGGSASMRGALCIDVFLFPYRSGLLYNNDVQKITPSIGQLDRGDFQKFYL